MSGQRHGAENDRGFRQARTPRGAGAAVVGLMPSPAYVPPTLHLDGPPSYCSACMEGDDLGLPHTCPIPPGQGDA